MNSNDLVSFPGEVNPVSYPVKAEFHYAILVADRSEAGRRPVADLLAHASSLLAIGQIAARCRSASATRGAIHERS